MERNVVLDSDDIRSLIYDFSEAVADKLERKGARMMTDEEFDQLEEAISFIEPTLADIVAEAK